MTRPRLASVLGILMWAVAVSPLVVVLIKALPEVIEEWTFRAHWVLLLVPAYLLIALVRAVVAGKPATSGEDRS